MLIPGPASERFKATVLCLSCFTLGFSGPPTPAEEKKASVKMPITTSSPQARAAYLEGQALLDSFRIEESLPLFERAVALDPNFVMGWVGVAFSQPRFKDMFELADKAKNMLTKAEVSESERLFVLGFHASLNADPATHGEMLERLAALHPRDERILTRLGMFELFSNRDPTAAMKLADRALAAARDYPAALNLAGYAKLNQGRLQEAEPYFRRLVEKAPSDPGAWDSYGEMLLKAGRFGESLEKYQKAIEAGPLYESAHRGIATVLIHQDKHDEAIRRLEALASSAPNDGVRSGIHFALAVVRADRGDLKGALGELERNLVLSEKIQDTFAMALDLANMGRITLEAGRLDEALALYERSLQTILDSKDQPAKRKEIRRAVHQYRLGVIEVETGRLETAQAHALELERHAAGLGSPAVTRMAHDLPAQIALSQGKWDLAIQLFLEANSGDAYTMYRMSQAFEGKGDRANACKMLRHVDEYRGVLNLHYAFVRKQARSRLEECPQAP